MFVVDDLFLFCFECVFVVGVFGLGKMILFGCFVEVWQLWYIEIDVFFYGLNWMFWFEFFDDVCIFVVEECWVMEWQYMSKGMDEVFLLCVQFVVWFDYLFVIVCLCFICCIFVCGVL